MREEQGQERREQLKLIEAALFASGRAMGADELAGITGIASIGYVRKLAEELMEEYSARDSSIRVVKIGERYLLSLTDDYASRVSSVAGRPDLSKGALRILAYVSRNEPIMQSSLVKAFGSTVYDYMKELHDGDFVRTTKEGRSKKVETTQKFREYFNFSK
ncbi:MAG: SMC-Scp complex subunit ScpB [Candidatus Marsarchaeota archaeon]|nr:SMC-Scp complex subunit ScpB [Candidatus Marsarchaeota archaeon]MCL5111915.1 SMC-Scp complex subunit ScpB [Candidatus Marsarchaeota archaeon]